jgi:hypothetical protein
MGSSLMAFKVTPRVTPFRGSLATIKHFIIPFTVTVYPILIIDANQN